MRKFLLFIFLQMCLLGTSVQAQYIGLETQVPNGWSTNNGAGLSISADHYKLGTQSLRWDWTQSASLTVMNPPNLKTALNTYKGGLMLWVYNEVPLDRKITFEFAKGSRVEYTFEYGINFKGWRACWIRFDEDMSGSKSSKDLDNMKIVAPSDVASGSLFFDRMMFPSERVHDRVTPDQQLPYINPDMNDNHWCALWHWQSNYVHDIALEPTVSTEQQAAFDEIKRQLIRTNRGSAPTAGKITKVKAAFNTFGITRANGQIKGRPYVSDDEYESTYNDVKMEQVGSVLLDLARIYYHHQDNDAKQMFYDLLDHVMDQGLTVGSGMGTNHHYGYHFREFPPAIFLMKDALKADGRLDEAAAMINYWAGTQEYREAPAVGTLQGLLDSWNTTVMPRLLAIMTMDDSPEKARDMKNIKKWMDISLEIVPGSMGGIKEDGSGFHHGGLYPAYSVGGYAGVGTFLRYVNGSCFALSADARINFGKALMTMRNYTNQLDWGFGIAGRHPFHGSMSSSTKKAFAYLAKAGDPYTNAPIWEEMAAAYMRLETASNSLKTDFAKAGITAEETPQGNFTYNYGALGIHRRDNWMVTIKGFNKHVWGSEIYTKDNRYGRYQSYGTVQVIGNGSPVSSEESGFVEEGWDWNRYPGATSIHLPWNLLDSPLSGTLMAKSTEAFGGASNLEGQDGVFGIKLNEGNWKNFTDDHKANKSVFSFDKRIICLGSDIVNTNSQYNTETTLFQVHLKNQADAMYMDGSTAISTFPYNQTLAKDQKHYFIDPAGNAYWVKEGNNLKVSRATQHSKSNQLKADTQGDFASLWIDHGKAPSNQSYEYVILPNSDLQGIQDFSTQMQTEATAAYKVLQQDSKAHIVWDRESNTTGYVFFELNDAVNNEFVKAVTSPSLVMIKSSANNKELSLSMCDPDLHFPQVAFTSVDASQESIVELTLNGAWDISVSNPKCKLIMQDDTQTRLQFRLKDGIPQGLKLKKVVSTSIYQESFELAPGADTYVLNTPFETSAKIYFGRYDIANVSKYYLNSTKMQGVDQDWFLAGSDVTQAGSTGVVDVTLKEVDLPSYQDLKLRVSLASLISPKYKFDAASDSLFVEYQANGSGEYRKIAAFHGFTKSGDAWHGAMGLDEDFDGRADGLAHASKYIENGLMKDFTFNIPESDLSSIRVRIRISTDHYYEGISIDNVRLLDFENTAPHVTLLSLLSSDQQTAQFELATTVVGKVYYVVQESSLAIPDAVQVKSSNQLTDYPQAGISQILDVSGLNSNVSYTVYVVVEDALGNLSAVKVSSAFSISGSDKTAPAILHLAVNEINNSSALASIQTNEDGIVYWMVAPADSESPSADDLQSGLEGVDAGQLNYQTDDITDFTVNSLMDGTEYTLYALSKDADGNASHVYKTELFSTLNTGLDDLDVDALDIYCDGENISIQSGRTLPDGTQLTVLSLTGRTIFQKSIGGTNTYTFSLNYPSGIYLVRISDNKQNLVRKVFLK